MKRVPLLVLMSISVLVSIAPLLTDANPTATNAGLQLQPPSVNYLLGTDYLGRDVWARVLYGGRRTLLIAVAATLIAVVPGSLLGMLAAGSSDWFDTLLTMLLNTLLAFPALVFALLILTLLGSSDASLVVATGIPQIAYQAQIARTAAREAFTQPYVHAAHSLGASRWHILRQHIWRTIRPTLLTYAGLIFGYSIINAAGLSFLLGLGGAPDAPEWGRMLADGRNAFRMAPWVAVAPGVMITLTVVCVNRLIDQITQSR